jgi:shikimate O-hydroxycinnamoyltransferase
LPRTSELLTSGVAGPSIPLTGIDIMARVTTVHRLIAFQHSLDGDELRAGLARSLRDFPVLTGRLKRDADNLQIVLNDHGLLLERVDIDEAIPALGKTALLKPGARRLSVRLSLSPADKDRPLAGIRVTRFSNGTVIAFSTIHSLCDGHSAWMFMNSWSQYVRCAKTTIVPYLDRRRLIRLGEESQDKGPCFENRFLHLGSWQRTKVCACLLMNYLGAKHIVYHLPEGYLKQKKQEVMRKLRDEEWVSTQDVAAALILDAVNHVLPGDSGEVSAFYNLRGVDGLRVPDSYFGNAVVARTWKETREPDQLARIALNLRRRKQAITRDSVSADLGYLERERKQGTAHALVQASIPASCRRGILINNYSRFPIYSVDFGKGPPVWCDYPAFPAQLAIINPHPQGDGVVVHLCLKRRAMNRLLGLPSSLRHFDGWLQA